MRYFALMSLASHDPIVPLVPQWKPNVQALHDINSASVLIHLFQS